MRFLFSFVVLFLLSYRSTAQLTANVSNTNASCFGACDGAAFVSVFGGVPPYSYTWSPGNFNGPSVSNLCAGGYTIQVRDAQLTTATFSVIIAQPPAKFINSTIQPQTCTSQGAATLSVFGGMAPYFYSWIPNVSNGPIIQNVAAGNYTCTVIGIDGCPQDYTLTVPLASSAPSITITGPSTVCSQYTQTFTANGASNYTWSGGQTGAVFTSSYVAQNNYMSTVTLNVVGYNTVPQCSATATKIFTVWQSPIIFSSANAFCETATGHSITAVGAQTYSVTGNSWWVTPTVTTSYSITGTSAQGCVSFTPAITTLTVYPQFTLNVNQPTICPGETPQWSVTGAPYYTITANPNNSYAIFATDGFCSAMVIRYVYPFPSPTITASSGSICAGSSYTINTNGAATYSITGSNFTVSPAFTTTYAVTGTNYWGCTSNNPVLVTVSVVPNPTISANSGTICSGNSFAIIPSGASSYSISGGNYTVSPNTTTSYSISGNTSGCVSVNTAVATVTVDQRPLVSVNSGSICMGDTFTFLPQGAFNYSITGGQFTVAPTTNTVYYVVGSSSLNCPSLNAATASITVFSRPQISVIGPTAVCIGSPVTWSAVGASTYSWSNNLNSNPILFTPIFNTSYSVVGTDSQGCRDTSFNSVVVNSLPSIVASSGNPIICITQSTSIVCSGANTYTISGGVLNAVPFLPSVTTTYTITGQDVNGCENLTTVSVVVNPQPTVNIVSSSGSICKGNSTVLTALGATSYQWVGGPAASQFSVSPPSTSTYSVLGTDINGCSNTSQITVTVFPLPALIVLASANVVCAGESVVLTAQGASFYQWVGGPATSQYTVNPQLTASYTVTGTDVNSCKTQTVLSIALNDCTGITKYEEIVSVVLFPNPNNGRFTLLATSSAIMRIFSYDGKLVQQNDIVPGSNEVQLQSASKGFYRVQIENESGKSFYKVIVE